jgi:hypothetical protein
MIRLPIHEHVFPEIGSLPVCPKYGSLPIHGKSSHEWEDFQCLGILLMSHHANIHMFLFMQSYSAGMKVVALAFASGQEYIVHVLDGVPINKTQLIIL